MNKMFEIVKDLAVSQGLSINDLEKKLHLPQNALYALKKNKPSSDRLEAIADYFNVTTDYLLGRKEKTEIDEHIFYRMNTKGLTKEEIIELRKHLTFAEQLAIEAIKRKAQGE